MTLFRICVVIAFGSIITGCLDDLAAPAQPEPACTVIDGARLEQRIEQLKQYANRAGLVRALITVRDDPACKGVEQAKATLVSAFRGAGALLVEPVDGRPLIVVECTIEQVREVAKSGLIQDVGPDKLLR